MGKLVSRSENADQKYFRNPSGRQIRSFLLMFFILFASFGGESMEVSAATVISFSGEELLGRPTDSSITINIVPNTTIEYHYQYGTTSGSYSGQTSNYTAVGGEPHEITITGLAANTQYFYRMRYHLSGEPDWVERSEHSFWTQRSAGEEFVFTVTSDSHVDIMLGSASVWTQAMTNVAGDNPDFNIDLGDTFAMDNVTSLSVADANYLAQREFFDIVGHSSSIFVMPGNHEQTEGWHLDDTGDVNTSPPVMSTNMMKKYYLNPIPDSFYTGNTDTFAYIDGDGLLEDYYAWEWGDALFVVIDPYWYTTTKPYTGNIGGGEGSDVGSSDRWDWTLGYEQFMWLKNTLEGSDAAYKFVMSHHMVGGSQDYVRGGAVPAHMFEWGGYNLNGTTWGFNTERPGWGDDPVHQIFIDTGVSAYIHGHDHEYAYEVRDGIVYQSMPAASFTGGFGIYDESDPYTEEVISGAGYLRFTVGISETTVEFIDSTTSKTKKHEYTIEPNEPPETHELTISVDPSGGGSTNPSAGVHTYAQNAIVNITATANTGYEFDYWSGACSGSGSCQVTMDGDKSVTAHFAEIIPFTLTMVVNPPAGGVVTPSGSNDYNPGTVVNIAATAASGYTFVNWTGDVANSTSPSTTVTMNSDKTVTANFTPVKYLLTVVNTGSGDGTVTSVPPGIDCGSNCTAEFDNGTEVTLTAVAAPGSVFSGWSGSGCSGTDECVVSMTTARTVTATFTITQRTLTVTLLGDGDGEVMVSPLGVTCSDGPCAYGVNYGTLVTLTVNVMEGSIFTGWGGACSGTDPCQLTMDENKSISATFEIERDEYWMYLPLIMNLP